MGDAEHAGHVQQESVHAEDPVDFSALIQRFLRKQDWDGSVTTGVAAALARAALPLQTDWVREFMLSRDDAAADVAILTSPAAAAPSVISAALHSSGDGMPDCNDVLTHMFIPCATVADDTVGLVVSSEPQVEGTDTSTCIGRYHFANQTGSLLFLASTLPHEEDTTIALLSTLRLIAGGPPIAPSDTLAARPRTKVFYWPSVRGRVGPAVPLGAAVAEKLSCVVDDDLFCKGEYARSILVATHVAASTRRACGDCLAAELAGDGAGGDEGQRAALVCGCRDVLVPPAAPLDFEPAARNLRLAVGGSWVGASVSLTRIPALGGKSPVCVARRSLSMSLQFDSVDSAALCARLQALAIDRVSAQAPVPRLILPAPPGPLENDAVEVDAFLVAEAGDPSVDELAGLVDVDVAQFAVEAAGTPVTPPRDDATNRGASISASASVSVCEGGPQAVLVSCAGAAAAPSLPAPAPPPPPTEAALRSRKLAEARRERNRIAAARSNARRKLKNDTLKASLRESRRRAIELKIVEAGLRARNDELRARLDMVRGAGGREAAVSGKDARVMSL
jgi:hypothetical protein